MDAVVVHNQMDFEGLRYILINGVEEFAEFEKYPLPETGMKRTTQSLYYLIQWHRITADLVVQDYRSTWIGNARGEPMRNLRSQALAVMPPVAMLMTLACAAFAQDFKKQVIYQIVTDRFFNGDSTNDNPAQSAGLFDPTQTDWRAYWGGDLAGIEQ